MKNRSKTRLIHVFVLTALMLTIAGSVQAQVKFGQNSTTVNANSLLELESTNKGLLLPRVALSATNSASPLSAHVAGMVVYNTATAGTAPNNVTPGYYYNDGAKWLKVANTNDIQLPNVPLTSSTSPAGTAIGQMIYNTTNVTGPPAVPVGPTYWDGTNWVPVVSDAFVGNEVTNATTNKGLSRAGSGTASSPFTLGLTDGTATNQTMVWNGTSWVPGSVGLTQVNLTSLTTPAGTNIGDMIYNTNSSVGPVGPTYWDGSSWVPVAADAFVGNEVTNGTTNMGLTRSGSGTASSPFTLGLPTGTSANQTMVWNGTSWAAGKGGLVSTPLTSSTSPAGNNIGDMIYNTSNITGPPAVPVGPTYWDGTNWVPVSADPAIGNEVTNATTNKGLARAGSGTASSPFTLGLTDGTAASQTMVWNGTSWVPGSVGLTQVNLTSLTTPAGTNIGDMIYNTNSSVGPVGPTYWDGTKWVPVSGSDWTTKGNSVNGGNFLGTTNNASLRIRTNNTQKMVIDSMGKVGIGTSTPTSTLEVNGSATNTTAFNAGSSTSISFTNSNLAYTSANAGAFTLTGMKDGGTYTLAVQGATAGTASFTHAGLTFRQVNNAATTASKHTLYTFIVMGTTVYYWMNGGL